jgi:hypothetical protein
MVLVADVVFDEEEEEEITGGHLVWRSQYISSSPPPKFSVRLFQNHGWVIQLGLIDLASLRRGVEAH